MLRPPRILPVRRVAAVTRRAAAVARRVAAVTRRDSAPLAVARRAGLILALAVACMPVSAQTARISGRVTDAEGRPLPGVNVVLKGTLVGTASGVDGTFALERVEAGRWTLTATAVGFRTAERTIVVAAGAETRVDFVLEEVVIEQAEIVVTASRRAQAALDVPASVAVLTPRDLERRNVIAFDDALRYIPGVHVQENQVNVRGSSGFAYNTGSRVLMLLDGIPLLTPDTDGMPFDALPFAQIERIEVLKGPGSALYGSGALGGVVNVITKRFPDRPQTQIRAYAGVWEPVRYETWRRAWDGADRARPFAGVTFAHARRFTDRLGAWLNLAWRRDDGYLNYSSVRLFQGYGKLGWEPSSQVRATVLVGILIRSKDNFLFWNGARDVLNPGTLAIGQSEDGTPGGTNDVFGHQVSFLPAVTHVVSPRFVYTVKARLFGTVIRPIDNETGRPKSVDEGTLGFRYGGEVQADWSPRAASHVTLGAAGDALATRSSFFETSDGNESGSQPETAVFAQWEEDVARGVRLTAGLRLDRYDVDRTQTVQRLSPKLGGTWRVAGSTTIRAAWGHGFRVPSLAERFTDNRDFFPIVRNPGLLPERSLAYEVGVRSSLRPWPAWNLELDGALFRNEYWDLIEPRLQPAIRAFQFVNLTRARIRGFEVSADLRPPGGGDAIRLGYTFLDADDLSIGEALAFRARHQVTAGLDLAVRGPWEVGIDVRLMSAAERVDTDFARFVRDADRLVPVRVVDLRVGFRSKKVRVAVLAQNAFEYYYAERPAYLAPTRRFTLQTQLDL